MRHCQSGPGEYRGRAALAECFAQSVATPPRGSLRRGRRPASSRTRRSSAPAAGPGGLPLARGCTVIPNAEAGPTSQYCAGRTKRRIREGSVRAPVPARWPSCCRESGRPCRPRPALQAGDAARDTANAAALPADSGRQESRRSVLERRMLSSQTDLSQDVRMYGVATKLGGIDVKDNPTDRVQC